MSENNEIVYVGDENKTRVQRYVDKIKREDGCEVVYVITGDNRDYMDPMEYTYAELKCPNGTLKKYKNYQCVSKYSHYEKHMRMANGDGGVNCIIM